MNFVRDLRYGLRILTRSRAFAGAAIAVLALGIGAATAVFSVVRGVLLTPLGYREANRVVLFRADLPGYAHQAALTAQELFALRERSDLFESVAVINESEGNLTAPEQMAAVTAASVSDNFFDTLGVAPMVGRSISQRDIGQQWVAGVDISYEVWQRQFHGDPAIVGRQIEVNNRPKTVVGVLPRGFRLYLGPGVIVPTQVDIWYPRVAGYDVDPMRGHVVVARLHHGITLDTARAAVATLAADLVAQHPSSYGTGPVRLSIDTIDREVVSEVKPAVTAIAGAVAFVLLVACANLTNLLLARASARTRELAVRISIGASRGHIVRQLLAEGVVVGGVGAVAGLLLAQWGVDLLVRLAPAVLPRREAIQMDGGAALFAIALSIFCTLTVSLVSAWHLTRTNLADRLKRDPSSSRGAATIRGALVASQLALSLMLLVGAGLMARTFISMRQTPLGFDPSRVLSMSVALQLQRFGTGTLEEARTIRLAFYHQLAESVAQIPGVEQVGVGLPVPLSGGGFIAQRYALDEEAPERQAEGIVSLAGFLDTLRVPLMAGRYFAADDDDRPVIIVDQQIAEDLWPGEAAIGRRLLLKSLRAQWAEIVGVVAHVQTQDLRQRGLPQIWMTYATKSYAGLNVVARGRNPLALAPMVERAVQQLGPGRPVHDVRLLKDYVTAASADTRFAFVVLGVFAFVAVVLAGIGVYGVVAYATACRTREIAVRMALGAAPRGIVSLVVRDGLAWTAVGVVAGIGGALVLSRYLGALLFRVGERDPLTFITVALLLGGIVMATMGFTALRAVRIDPMLALRAD